MTKTEKNYIQKYFRAARFVRGCQNFGIYRSFSN
jgi:hypothetical protein